MKQIVLASTTMTSTQAGGTHTFNFDPEELIVTLNITVHDRTHTNETADIYVTTGDGVSTWDIVHFPQIASTGVKTYTATINTRLLGQNVTTAAPGVAANDPGCLKTDTSGSDQGIKTLTAGYVRHGPVGNRIGYQFVAGGTSVSTTFSITVSMR